MTTASNGETSKSGIQAIMDAEVTRVEEEAYRLEAECRAAERQAEVPVVLQDLLYCAKELQQSSADYQSGLTDKNASYAAISRVVDYATKIVKELDALSNPAPQSEPPTDKRNKSTN